MDIFRKEVAELIAGFLGWDVSRVLSKLEIPPQLKFGHFAFPCFELAKERKKSPKDIALEMASFLKKSGSISRIEAVGPYVNFTIDQHRLAEEVLRGIFLKKDKYGSSLEGDGKTVVIEFSSPNVAKPFGIGHLRSTNIGACLSRVYSFLGYRVIRINHLGDWGTQFGKLITAYKRFGSADFLKEDPLLNLYKLYVRFHKEEEEDPSLTEEAREWFAKLEKGDPEAVELWEWFRDLSVSQFNKMYDLLGVKFDYTWGESFYKDKIDATIERLKKKGLLEKSEGAWVVKFKDEDMPPMLIKKSDDSSLYATRDLCAAEYRYERFHFDRMLYVVGSPQSLHFRQLFKVLKMMGYEWADRCEHVEFGHLTLSTGKSMSTRKGNIVLLRDVIDSAVTLAKHMVEQKNPHLENKEQVATQVGIGAVLFADLGSRRRKEVKFSMDEILNFDGETGPYLQYAYVRMKSLEEKYQGVVDLDVDIGKLSHDSESELIYHLAGFSDVLRKVVEENEPFFLARYLIDLAKLFSRFYHDCRVIDPSDEDLSAARMLLVACTSIVLKSGLSLLGIAAPDKM